MRVTLKHVLMILSAGLCMSACQSSINTPTQVSSPTITPPQSSISAVFQGVQIAYINNSNQITFVSTDGTPNSIAIKPLKYNPGANGIRPVNRYIAPDGHTFASAIGRSLYVLDLLHNHEASFDLGADSTLREIAWSSDSKLIAVSNGILDFDYFNVSEQKFHPIPTVNDAQHTFISRLGLIGWQDATHLLVYHWLDDKHIVISTMALETGTLQDIAQVSSPAFGSIDFSLSPDGNTILISNKPFLDFPYQPLLALISAKDGKVTLLSRAAQQTKGNLSNVAWRPETNQIAITSNNDNGSVWLIDAQTDSATRLLEHQYAREWSPDGKKLLCSMVNQDAGKDGTFTLTAFTLAGEDITESKVLTAEAIDIDWIGIVHNP
jgi:hypothetical protein